MSDAERSVPASPSSPSSRSAHCLLSDDVIVQVLQWLPVPCAVHSGRTSKAFSRAALASLRRGTWATTRDDDCRGRHGSSSTEETAASSEEEEEEGALLSQGGRLGTPCLDLRSAGDAVDCAALLGLLGRGFKAGSTTPPMRQEERQRQSSTGGRSKASVEGVDVISSSGACSKSGIVFTPSERKQERPVLRGLAVRSSALEDEALLRALDSHGKGLQILSVAGCRGLSSPTTLGSIGRKCKSLVELDLSGTFCGGAYASVPSLTANVLFLACHQAVERDHTLDNELAKLISGVGSGLRSLYLCDCPHISHRSLNAIAASCTKLKELDIGSERWPTGVCFSMGSETVLLSSPCAKSLEYLGVRNRASFGRFDGLQMLGSQLPNLKRLDLAGLDNIGQEALETLSSKLSLTHLDLSRCGNVSDAGIRFLAQGSPELVFLSLHSTGVSDGGVRALCDECPKLRRLNLSLTRVTVRSLGRLADKDALRWLNVRCCPLYGEDTIRIMTDLRHRLSARRQPADRGVILGMERPENQFRRPISPPDCRVRGDSRKDTVPVGSRGAVGRRDHGRVRDTGLAARGAGACGVVRSTCRDERGGVVGVPDGDGIWEVELRARSLKLGIDRRRPNGASGASGASGAAAPKEWAAGGYKEELGRVVGISAAAVVVAARSLPAEVASQAAVGGETTTSSVRSPSGQRRERSSSGSMDKHPEQCGRGEGERLQGGGEVRASTASGVSAAAADADAAPAAAAAAAAAAKAEAATAEAPKAEASCAASQERLPCDGVSASASRDRVSPLLPAGVGDLSQGQRGRRREGTTPRRLGSGGGGSGSGCDTASSAQAASAGSAGRSGVRAEAKWMGGDVGGAGTRTSGAAGREEKNDWVLPFDWDSVPRGSVVGELAGWKGFKGLSGDLVGAVIKELHPFVTVDFFNMETRAIPPRKAHHGYQVQTSKFGIAWVELQVDEQGCVA